MLLVVFNLSGLGFFFIYYYKLFFIFLFLVTNGFPPSQNNQAPLTNQGSFHAMAKPPTSNFPPPLSKPPTSNFPPNNLPSSQLKTSMQPTSSSSQIPFGTPTNLRQPTSVSNNPQVNGHLLTQSNMHQQQTNGQRMPQAPMMPNGQVSHQQPGNFLSNFLL